jgi:hypothetical protein
MERTVTKALRMCLRTYYLFRSGCLSVNINFTLYKDLITSVMTYTCLTWKYEADGHLLKRQRLQNWVLCATGNLNRREMHVAFTIPYVYNYINKLCRTQAEGILNHRNPIVHGFGQGEPMHRKYKLLKSGLQWLRLVLSKGPNRVGVSLHLRTETDPVSET